MTGRGVAGRYARALFDVALRQSDPQKIEQELAEIAALVARHDALRGTLANPAIPVAAKRGIVTEIAQRAGVSPILAKLLALMAERDRFAILDDVVDAYRARVMDHLQVVRAEVTTAVPLAADRASALERSLAQATGKRVSVTTRVDPAIVGGVVARIGSVVYDGSVTRQLEKLKEKLAEET